SGAGNPDADWKITAVGDVRPHRRDVTPLLTVPEVHKGSAGPTAAGRSADDKAEDARYQEVSGHEVHDVGYYSAFAMWKLACIREGVYTRLATGKMGDLDLDPEVAGAGVEELAQQALTLLEQA